MSSPAHLEDLADRIAPRAASNLLLWMILAFLGVFLVWASLTRLDRTVRGQGRVIASNQLQVVSNLEGGIVDAILVKTGQLVQDGAELIRLDRTQPGAELGSGEATLNSLRAKISRLEAEVASRTPSYPASADPALTEQIAVERALHASRMADRASGDAAAVARIRQAERAVAEAVASHAARVSARNAARAELSMIRPLVDRGIEPRLSLVQAENAAAVAASEVAAAAAAISRAQAAVAEARSARSQQQQEWRARAADELSTAQAELGTRRRALPALADRVQRTSVRAPVAGRINRVLVTTPGGTVRPGDPLVEIVPDRDTLLVEAMIRPQDIATVRLGQSAKVNITAYDSAVYGSLNGRVITITPDAVVNERTGESFYLVRVRTEGNRTQTGERLLIGPGMVAEVNLLGNKRSVLSYLLSPITKLRDRAFRE